MDFEHSQQPNEMRERLLAFMDSHGLCSSLPMLSPGASLSTNAVMRRVSRSVSTSARPSSVTDGGRSLPWRGCRSHARPS